MSWPHDWTKFDELWCNLGWNGGEAVNGLTISFKNHESIVNALKTERDRLASRVQDFEAHLPTLLDWIDGALKANRNHLMTGNERGAYLLLREALAAQPDRRQDMGSRADNEYTQVLDCGCTMTKGWRCPMHDGP